MKTNNGQLKYYLYMYNQFCCNTLFLYKNPVYKNHEARSLDHSGLKLLFN